MDAITPRKAILLQKTQSFVEQARASADNETVENKALKAEKKHEKPPKVKRKALKKHKSDTFEVTTKPKLVPQPVIITTKVDPASNRGTLVLATMGFIASLGAVFGVGVLLAKSNQTEEAMATRFTNLEQAITTEWGNNTLLLGKYLQENANEVLASSSEALKDLNEAMILMTQSFNKNSTELDKLYQRMDKVNEFVAKMGDSSGWNQYVARTYNEQSLEIKGVKGGDPGFIKVYIEKNDKAVDAVSDKLFELRGEHGIKDSLERCLTNTNGEYSEPVVQLAQPLQPLVTLMREHLTVEDRRNPRILHYILDQIQVALTTIQLSSLTVSVQKNSKNIPACMERLAVFQKGLEYYTDPEGDLTKEYWDSIKEMGYPAVWVQNMGYSKRNNFSILQETFELMTNLKIFIEDCNNGSYSTAYL